MTKRTGRCNQCQKEVDIMTVDVDGMCPECHYSAGRNIIKLMVGIIMVILAIPTIIVLLGW